MTWFAISLTIFADAHTITAKNSMNILILQGHPDSDERHFCHAAGAAYQAGAENNGHKVRIISVTKLDFPLIRSQDEFEHGALPPDIQQAQQAIQWCHHMVLIYPIWLGTMPALFKGFLEQTFRYGFAISEGSERFPKGLLADKSARIIVTMGMPAFAYHWFFGAHGLFNLEKSILKLAGLKPVKHCLFGLVENDKLALKRLDKLRALGAHGS